MVADSKKDHFMAAEDVYQRLAGWLHIGVDVKDRDHIQLPQQLHFRASRGEDRKLVAELHNAEGQVLACPGPWSYTIMQAAARLVQDRGVDITAVLLRAVDGNGNGLVQMSVALPEDLSSWKPNPAAVTIFNALKPLEAVRWHEIGTAVGPLSATSAGGSVSTATEENMAAGRSNCAVADDSHIQPNSAENTWLLKEIIQNDSISGSDRRSLFTLESCFKELPSCKSDPARPTMQYADMTLHERQCLGESLHGLPEQVLWDIMARLDPISLSRLTCTCRYMRVVCWDAAPGLRLTLYPHQRAAVRWMLQHESRRPQSQYVKPWPIQLPGQHVVSNNIPVVSTANTEQFQNRVSDPTHALKQMVATHLSVTTDPAGNDHVQLRLAIPYGDTVPSGQTTTSSCSNCTQSGVSSQGADLIVFEQTKQQTLQQPPAASDRQQLPVNFLAAPQTDLCQVYKDALDQWASEHPVYRRLTLANGVTLFANIATGELLLEAPPPVIPIQGGLFCDEPGLGKTVTAMSLILKTLGMQPKPPPNMQAVWSYDSDGKRLGGFYCDLPEANNGNSSAASIAAQGVFAGHDYVAAVTSPPRTRRQRALSQDDTPLNYIPVIAKADMKKMKAKAAADTESANVQQRRQPDSRDDHQHSSKKVKSSQEAVGGKESVSKKLNSHKKQKVDHLANGGSVANISAQSNGGMVNHAINNGVCSNGFDTIMMSSGCISNGVPGATAAQQLEKQPEMTAIKENRVDSKPEDNGYKSAAKRKRNGALRELCSLSTDIITYEDVNGPEEVPTSPSKSTRTATSGLTHSKAELLSSDCKLIPSIDSSLVCGMPPTQHHACQLNVGHVETMGSTLSGSGVLCCNTATGNSNLQFHSLTNGNAAFNKCAWISNKVGQVNPMLVKQAFQSYPPPDVYTTDGFQLSGIYPSQSHKAPAAPRGLRHSDTVVIPQATANASYINAMDISAWGSATEIKPPVTALGTCLHTKLPTLQFASHHPQELLPNLITPVTAETAFSVNIISNAATGDANGSAHVIKAKPGFNLSVHIPKVEVHTGLYGEQCGCHGACTLHQTHATPGTNGTATGVHAPNCCTSELTNKERDLEAAVMQEGDVMLPQTTGPLVQCDACGKWRLLPPNSQLEEDQPWFCEMHPDPALADCTVPEQDHSWLKMDNCPGFMHVGEEGGIEANVDRFFEVLCSFGGTHLKQCVGILCHLACNVKPTQLHITEGGVKIGNELGKNTAHANKYVPVFQKLDLIRASDWFKQEAKKQSNATSSKKKRTRQDDEDATDNHIETYTGNSSQQRRPRTAANNKDSQLQHTWIQHPDFGSQLFDQYALQLALAKCVSTGLMPKKLLHTRIQPLVGKEAFTSPLESPEGVSQSRVFLSPATLVVVPNTLVPHWRNQLSRHIRAGLLRVCEVTSDSKGPATTKDLAWKYDVVITTFNRLASEWSPKSAGGILHKGNRAAGIPVSLLQVHWLRIILDEGHMLGVSLSETNKLQVACQLRADRRWIMTGTPTPSHNDSGAAHLQPLLAFLKHVPYGASKRTWEAAVLRPLEACKPYGRDQLLRLLRANMIRASKADLLLLPELRKTVVRLDFAVEHAESYNALVEVVRRNLLLADWHDEDHRESLMNAKQSKWAAEMMNNVRLSCCVAGSMNLVAIEQDILETLELLCEKLGYTWPAQAWHEFNEAQQKDLQSKDIGKNQVEPSAMSTDDSTQDLQLQKQGVDIPVSRTSQVMPTEVETFDQNGPYSMANDSMPHSKASAHHSTFVPSLIQSTTSNTSVTMLDTETPSIVTPKNASSATAVNKIDADDVSMDVDDNLTVRGKLGPSSPQAPRRTPSVRRAQLSQHPAGMGAPGMIGGRWLPPGHPLDRVETSLRHGVECEICQIFIKQPLVTPCAHLLCLDCASTSSTHCPKPGCGAAYLMQPVDDPARFKHNPNPKWPVPLEVIEWQPVYTQYGAKGVQGGEWSANWQITRSTRCLYLIRRLRELGLAVPKKPTTDSSPLHTRGWSANHRLRRHPLNTPGGMLGLPGAQAQSSIHMFQDNDVMHQQRDTTIDIWAAEPLMGKTPPLITNTADKFQCVGSLLSPVTFDDNNSKVDDSSQLTTEPVNGRSVAAAGAVPISAETDTGLPVVTRKRVCFADERSSTTADNSIVASTSIYRPLSAGSHPSIDPEMPATTSQLSSSLRDTSIQQLKSAVASPSSVSKPKLWGKELHPSKKKDQPQQSSQATARPQPLTEPSAHQHHQHPQQLQALQSALQSALHSTLQPISQPTPRHMDNMDIDLECPESPVYQTESAAFTSITTTHSQRETTQPSTLCQATSNAEIMDTGNQQDPSMMRSTLSPLIQLDVRPATPLAVSMPEVRYQWTRNTNGIMKPKGILKVTSSPAGGDDSTPAGHVVEHKVIVFSQFWMHLQLLAQEMTRHGIAHVILRAGRNTKAVDRHAVIEKFATDPTLGVLLMDDTGAVGLDLSFVTHVFLMEPLADRSLEHQIVSRAHRMGATRPVHVELLVMRGTAEEKLLKMYSSSYTTQDDKGEATSSTAARSDATMADGLGNGDGTPAVDEQEGDIAETRAAGRSARNLFFRSLRKVNIQSLTGYDEASAYDA